jgi:hypothetical protein
VITHAELDKNVLVLRMTRVGTNGIPVGAASRFDEENSVATHDHRISNLLVRSELHRQNFIDRCLCNVSESDPNHQRVIHPMRERKTVLAGACEKNESYGLEPFSRNVQDSPLFDDGIRFRRG